MSGTILVFTSQDHLGFRKPVRGYEFFQNSKLSGSIRWNVEFDGVTNFVLMNFPFGAI